MLEIQKIDTFEELLKLETEWNSLLEKSQANNPFLSFEWISNWWKCFGKDRELFILLVKEEDKIVGIAPLMVTPIKKLGISLKKIEFIGMPLSDYSDFIISEKNKEVLQKIYDYLIENKSKWNFIKLNSIPEASSTLRDSRELFNSKNLFKISFSDVCPSIVFDGTWQSLKEKIDNKKTRRSIRYFIDNGEFNFSKCQSPEQAKEMLNVFFEQHKKRWNTTKTPSMFNDEKNKKFFELMVPPLLQKEKIGIFYISFKQKPISFVLAFLYNNTFLVYSSSYDPDYSKQSPSKILHKMLFEYCESQKLAEFDFLKGGEKYKLRLANKIKKNYSINIYKNRVLYLFGSLSNLIEKKIKENEMLYDFFIKYEKKLRIF